jgi:hypothetical protein
MPVTFHELVAYKSSFHCFHPRLTKELFAFLEFCWTRKLVNIFVKECIEFIHFISSALSANSDMVAVAKDCLVVCLYFNSRVHDNPRGSESRTMCLPCVLS